MSAVFRCDATTDIGFGHLSRCMALAEAFRISAIDSVFVGKFDAAAIDQLSGADFESISLAAPLTRGNPEQQALSGALGKDGGNFLVVDSYRADENYLADVKGLARRTVVIDDFKALPAYPCDVIFNFTWDAAGLDYPRGPTLLLGPEYFPARRRLVELREGSIGRSRSGPVRNLLLAIGGSDPKGIARRLVRILGKRQGRICLRVVAANVSDFGNDLEGFAPGSQILPRLPDLSEQLAWADACVTGGGLIKYESAFMGVPAAAISQNAGQAGETQTLTRSGLVFDLGLADDRSDTELALALDAFLGDDSLRGGLEDRVRAVFPPDPSANAASAIAQALGR